MSDDPGTAANACDPDAYDLVVLGGGPAGVRAATEAGSRGLRVALVERAPFVHGAPTGAHSKCLREAALAGARSWEDVRRYLDRAVANSRANAARSLRTFRVEVIRGTGTATGPGAVEVALHGGGGTRAMTARGIVIATGSSSNRFPPVAACFDAGLAGVYDSDTIWSLDYLPRRVAIQGGGIIGLEYAMIFARLGAESVTIFEVADDVVESLDAALRAAIKAELAGAGIALHCRTAIASVAPEPRGDIAPRRPLLRVGARGAGGDDAGPERFLEGCDLLLAAPGRHGNSAGIGLEALDGVRTGRGRFVEADATTGLAGAGGVYAVGDVAGANLATEGQAQATCAVRHMFGSGLVTTEEAMEHKPSGVWMIPELAWVGLTEDEARARRPDARIDACQVSFGATVRGCVLGDDEPGFLKLVFDADSAEILGVHLFGEGSVEIVNYGADLLHRGQTVYGLLRCIFPAVTFHELYHLAATEAKLRMRGVRSLAAATAWKRMYAELEKTAEGEEGCMVAAAFERFDRDGSGLLDDDELRRAMESLGVSLEEGEVEDMMREAMDGETDLDYRHFHRILVKGRRGSLCKGRVASLDG